MIVQFTHCLDGFNNDHEALLSVVDILDPITTILSDSTQYLHKSTSGLLSFVYPL
jgi:hypothetical protein